MRLSQRSAARRERLVTAVISIFAGVGALALASVFLSFFAAWGDMSAGSVKAMSGQNRCLRFREPYADVFHRPDMCHTYIIVQI